MEEKLNQIYDVLNKLVGLHRKLLEVVRLEREHLIEAQPKAIETITQQKHFLIEEIHQIEIIRIKLSAEFAVENKKNIKELTLKNLILAIQGEYPKIAQQLQSVKNTLLILSQRISEQNKENLILIERSLEHIEAMKRNLIQVQDISIDTYSQQGQKISSHLARSSFSQEV